MVVHAVTTWDCRGSPGDIALDDDLLLQQIQAVPETMNHLRLTKE
jgi:hypothetical protein